jgi:hypothetical protein
VIGKATTLRALVVLPLLALIVFAIGCSPVERIAGNTNVIRQDAQALIDHGNAIKDAEVVDRATRIDENAADIHVQLTKVQDITPAWLSTLKWWGIAVAVAGIAFLVWNSGIGTAIRVAVGWLPRRKVAQAELAVDMLDPDRPEGEREYVAAMRAQDPEFDAAFRKAQTRRKA